MIDWFKVFVYVFSHTFFLVCHPKNIFTYPQMDLYDLYISLNGDTYSSFTLWLFYIAMVFRWPIYRNRWFTELDSMVDLSMANCECHNQRVTLRTSFGGPPQPPWCRGLGKCSRKPSNATPAPRDRSVETYPAVKRTHVGKTMS